MINNWHLIYSILILTFLFIADGQLIRDRTVQCNSNEMVVSFEFAQPFSGVVYANKFYQAKGCKWEGDGSRRLQLPIPLNANPASIPYCGVQLKEATGEFTATLIVSPMKSLLVDGMEGLTVRCLYTIADVTLTLPAGTHGAGIFVSPQSQAGVVTGSGGSPFLQMAIRDGHGINGDIIQAAQVGQRLTVDVVMRDTTIYDFYVHDCYAHDGTNTPDSRISIIDANGCAVRLSRAVDVPVFTTAPVPNGAKHVYVHMYGFQFTTSQLVYFECQVRPCLQTCNRAQCISSLGETSSTSTSPSVRIKRSDIVGLIAKKPSKAISVDGDEIYADNYNLTTVIRIESQESVENVVSQASNSIMSISDGSNADICVNTNVAAAILTIFAIICVASLLVAGFVCRKARHHKFDDKSTVCQQSAPSVSFASPASTMFAQMSMDRSQRSCSTEFRPKNYKFSSTIMDQGRM